MNVFTKSSINHFQSDAVKSKPEWYIGAFNTLAAIAKSNDNSDLLKIRDMIYGIIDKKDYNQYMNPFGFKEDRNKNIPGTLRNYDIMLSNIRRFIGEYVTSYQEFHVISKLPDEDNEMLIAANDLAYKLLSKKAVQQMKAFDGKTDPNETPVDVQTEVDQFKSRWKDNRVINDHNMLEYLRSQSKDAYLYSMAYFHWICYGRYFIDRRIESDDVIKEIIDPINAYPIGSADFVEDCDGFYYVKQMSLSDVLAHFRDVLTADQKQYLINVRNSYVDSSYTDTESLLITGLYKTLINDTDRAVANVEKLANDLNSIEVGTLYYKGFKEIKILKYQDILGNEFETEVANDYEINPLIGDISTTTEWFPLTYVQYRFGSKFKGVYTAPVEVPVQRQLINNTALVKIPVTGKVGIFPGFPNHSIPKLLYPFQVTVNLLHLVRERSIITAKGKIGIIPKELLGSDDIDQENELYNMLVTKTLFATTESIPNLATVIQSIKHIDLSDQAFIQMIDALITNTMEMANNAIDMNRQRAGGTYASDGKAVNQEAIARVSMGSAIINVVFDYSRCLDYQADIDFSKVAWINGKKGKFITTDRQQAFFEVNPVAHPETEYGVFVNNSFEYTEQRQRISDYAFSLGQNGAIDEDVVLDTITNKNISKLKEIIQVAKALRLKREDDKFVKEQENNQAIAQQQAQTAKEIIDNDRWKVETMCLNDLLIKEVELSLKQLDMVQDDKNNEVLAKITERKQALQTQLNVLHGRGQKP